MSTDSIVFYKNIVCRNRSFQQSLVTSVKNFETKERLVFLEFLIERDSRFKHMKRYKTKDVTNLSLIDKAISFAAKNKTKRKDVANTLAHKEDCKLELRDMIENRTFIPSPATKMRIVDGASKKERIIFRPKFFPDQCFHHVMMQAAVPVIMKGMSPHTFSSVPKRGPHYGKKFIRKWIDTDKKNTKYVAKLDIKKFYPSIPHDRLLQKIHCKFKDDTLIWMLETFVNSHEDSEGKGLAIGFYPSQWLSNFYLQDFDHYVKEELHIKYYGRYADDIVFFGCNKKVMHQQMQKIIKFLADEGLTVKDNWQIYRFDYMRKSDGRRCGRDLDFMGFRFFRDKTIIRRRNSLRIRRVVKIGIKHRYISVHRASSILSSIGWIKHTDSVKFNRRYVAGIINISACKKIVSRQQKEINKNSVTLAA